MNLTQFSIILCVFLADRSCLLRIVEGKPAAKINNDISFLEEFSVFRRIPPIPPMYDDDSEEQDEERSKESEEKEYEDGLIINGVISDSTSEATTTTIIINTGDDDDGHNNSDEVSKNGTCVGHTHVHDGDQKMSKQRPVRAADSNKTKNKKSTNKPKDEQKDAAIDEAMYSVGETSTDSTMTSAAPNDKKKYRRHSEVAKWPPALPYAASGQTDVHKFGGNSPKMDSDKSINAEGGIISTGKVSMSSEDSDSDAGADGGGESNSTDSSSSSQMDKGTTEDEEHVTVTYAPELESDDIMASTHKSDKKKTDKDKPGSGKAGTKPTMKPSGQRDISGSGSSNNVIKKPGKCRPLTSGLACIALSPDASQCSTDNSCPSSKKCCFYGCKPYQTIGICEFPVMN